MAYPGFQHGGGPGAVGPEGGKVWEGVPVGRGYPLPRCPLPAGGEVWEGSVNIPGKFLVFLVENTVF